MNGSDFIKYFKLGKNISLFIAVIFLFGLTSSAFNGFLGIYVKEIGYSEAVVGSLLSLRRLAVGFSAVIMAILASRFGRKNAVAFGLVMIGMSAIGLVSTKNIYFMQLMSITFGIGQSTLMTFEAPFIYSESNNSNRIHAFSASFAAKNAAFMMGSLGTGLLADIMTTKFSVSYIGIRYALLIISSMSFIALIPLSIIKNDGHEKKVSINIRDLKEVYSTRLLMLLTYTCIIGFGAGLVVPFFGVYLKYSLSISQSAVGTILAIAQLGTVIGGLTVPILARKYGKVNTITIVQMGSIPFLILIGVPMNIVLVSIAFFFRSSLMNMAQPLIQNLYMDIADDKFRPLISSLRSTVNNIARAGGILLGGYMMTNVSYSSPYAVTIACYLVGTILFRILFKKERKSNSIVQSIKNAK